MLSTETIAIIGFLCGPVARTLYDFFWTIRDNPDVFDRRYLLTMIASIAISIIVGLVSLPSLYQNMPTGSQSYVFASSLALGFMLNHIVNRPIDNIRHRDLPPTE